jgi:demethylmenaquinone methyltransferase / 2-methoxy-6-polyprenyl-1,4-benzoquinol methylase
MVEKQLVARSTSSFSKAILLLVLVIPFVAMVVHQVTTVQKAEAPPSDFGSGAMFDQIASRYDMINRVLALRMDVGWRQRMVQVVKQRVPQEHARLLDVATGTADVAMRLAKEIPSCTVLGLDPSNGMLDVGRTKIKEAGMHHQINLEWADARDFKALMANTFDGATMAFGIRNVPERDVALCEIHRVLRNGAVFCILEFSEPDDSFGVLGRMARVFIRHVVPVLGGLLSGAPREYLHLQNSIKDFPNPKEFGELMEGIVCNDDGVSGHFRVDDIVQMNFGSVQLYVSTAVKVPNEAIEKEVEESKSEASTL